MCYWKKIIVSTTTRNQKEKKNYLNRILTDLLLICESGSFKVGLHIQQSFLFHYEKQCSLIIYFPRRNVYDQYHEKTKAYKHEVTFRERWLSLI